MKIFENKFLVKIIASICIFLTLINFGLPNKVFAEDEETSWGGILITPFVKLFTSLSDGIMSILQKAVLEQDITLITIEGQSDWWNDWGKSVVEFIVAAVIVAVTAVIAWYIEIPVLIAVLVVGAVEVAAFSLTEDSAEGLAAKAIVGKLEGAWFDEDIYLPLFRLTPEEIFSNKIMLFDVNFFDPYKDYEYSEIATGWGKVTNIGVYEEFEDGARLLVDNVDLEEELITTFKDSIAYLWALKDSVNYWEGSSTIEMSDLVDGVDEYIYTYEELSNMEWSQEWYDKIEGLADKTDDITNYIGDARRDIYKIYRRRRSKFRRFVL